ncbi:putative Rab-GTPase-TBC domain-containing protein [Helianthus annuus]|nr:putative Rab-GTPase-TBC domain-containing protein [Helianthus annuus]
MLLSLLSKRTLRADFRDAYGFTVRPQYLETFKEFDRIYKNEEKERSTKWRIFLQQHSELGQTDSSIEEDVSKADADVTEHETKRVLESIEEENVDVTSDEKPTNDNQTENAPEKAVSEATKIKKPVVQNWAEVRSSLNTIENMMCHRVKNEPKSNPEKHLQTIHEVGPTSEDLNEELNDNGQPNSSGGSSAEVNPESLFPWKELESLVRGGVPRNLRGEAWQAFVGVKERRIESYYQNLLDVCDDVPDLTESNSHNGSSGEKIERAHVPEKCKKQIEKDLPRTFPGHPALNEEGRNSLRRLLLAYARHNPDVGYCQAMNFFAAMLLLMMPEENAFWTLVGMIDGYFDGYFTTDMIEAQVDQLVFEDLMRERYPNLVDHFDRMGVEMGWICGPWFLSIFVNMIPWESVLRVWDVILFEGNRAMLLRTALALMELYGPDVGSTMDAGDAITLLQSLVGSTFDSSNLIVTACISFSYVTEDTLQTLRQKHRPDVIAAVQERTKGENLRKSSKGLATKLYSFKKEREPIVRELSIKQGLNEKGVDKDSLDLMSPLKRDMSFNMEPIATEMDSLSDLQDQAIWLKAQLCSMLEDKRSATVRAEELETALMEMAQQDNSRELSARIEDMEHEMSELEQLLADKKEQEKAMLEVLMRVEQEQRIAEDARRSAERDAAAQKYLVKILEEKYEQAMNSLAQMEKRAVMAESMLEATKQYDSGQVKAQAMPSGNIRPESAKDNNTTKKTGILSFGLGWREKNKGKPETSDAKSEPNGHQEP